MQRTIGEYINQLRVNSSLTLTKLAAALDIDQSTLSKIENGKRQVPDSVIPKLCKVFDLDLNNLRTEFYAEKVAEVVYHINDLEQVFALAEEKAKYIRMKREHQGTLEL